MPDFFFFLDELALLSSAGAEFAFAVPAVVFTSFTCAGGAGAAASLGGAAAGALGEAAGTVLGWD